MSLITWPSFDVASCTLKLSTNQRVSASPFGGSEQAVDMLNDRWLLSLALPQNSHATAQKIEAFIGAMRGKTNTVNLYHFARPLPTGTARGATTKINTLAAQGASSIIVKNVSPSTGTLLAGDMLSAGTQLLMVATNCTAVAGVVTVPLVNRLRASLAVDVDVVWSSPTATFRLMDSSGIAYQRGMTGMCSMDFAEAI